MILLRTWPREFWEQNLPSRSSWSNVVIQPQHYVIIARDFPDGSDAKELACQCRRHKRCVFHPWVRKIPWRRKWQPTSVFLPGKFHRQRAWWATVHGVAELDTTEWLSKQARGILHQEKQNKNKMLNPDRRILWCFNLPRPSPLSSAWWRPWRQQPELSVQFLVPEGAEWAGFWRN